MNDEQLWRVRFGVVSFLSIVAIFFVAYLVHFSLFFSIFNPLSFRDIFLRCGFCVLMGFVGLSLRALYMVRHPRAYETDSPDKKKWDFLLERPLVILVGSVLVFSFLSIFGFSYNGYLFYTFASSLNIILGFFCAEILLAMPKVFLERARKLVGDD